MRWRWDFCWVKVQREVAGRNGKLCTLGTLIDSDSCLLSALHPEIQLSLEGSELALQQPRDHRLSLFICAYSAP